MAACRLAHTVRRFTAPQFHHRDLFIRDQSDKGANIKSSPSSDLLYALSCICSYTRQIQENTQSRASYHLTWPRHDDICYAPLQFVLCLVSASQACSNSACQYQLDNSVW